MYVLVCSGERQKYDIKELNPFIKWPIHNFVLSYISTFLFTENYSFFSSDFFCIEDLPKVTSEMDDLVPGQNGFEVLIKKWHVCTVPVILTVWKRISRYFVQIYGFTEIGRVNVIFLILFNCYSFNFWNIVFCSACVMNIQLSQYSVYFIMYSFVDFKNKDDILLNFIWVLFNIV